VTLDILDVRADPTLTFWTSGPGGELRWAQVSTGVCQVGHRSDRVSSWRGARSPAWLGFYVPGAGPIRPFHDLKAWGEASLAWAFVSGGKYSVSTHYGVDATHVELVDDLRGSGSLWPYLWMAAYGGSQMAIRYRLTVLHPESDT
jgi:hypothetical protein